MDEYYVIQLSFPECPHKQFNVNKKRIRNNKEIIFFGLIILLFQKLQSMQLLYGKKERYGIKTKSCSWSNDITFSKVAEPE
jgi:hypothetical protein